MYSKQAKKEGYRSRAAYKLLQIDEKFNLFGGKQTVIDLCGAPGGFSQIVRDRSRGRAKIFLVDLSRVKPIPKITDIIQGDITKLSTILKLRESIERSCSEEDEIVVLADCSPNVTGHWITDHSRQIWLTEVALGISDFFLANKFITKVFQGEFLEELLKKIKTSYLNVKRYKPLTSRKESAETYIIATDRIRKDKKLYDKSCLVLDE
ncbi:MAG: SAM-dependent methyltransferase [Candidatus Hodarchaeota archaeon]